MSLISQAESMTAEVLKLYIRSIPDFPRKGVNFRDISPLLANPVARIAVVQRLSVGIKRPDAVIGIESRGFIIGIMLADYWRVPFIMARKKDKLPGSKIAQSYSLEYGEEIMEMQVDALKPGQWVVIADDLLATGGTVHACIRLVQQCQASVEAVVCLIELKGLEGRDILAGYKVHTVISFDVNA